MQEKYKLLLFLFFLILTSCTDYIIPSVDWNNSLYQQLNQNYVFLNEDLRVKKEIDFVLHRRLLYVEQFNSVISNYKNEDIVVYENYNCEFNKNDTFETDIPFSKNKFYFEVTITIKRENKFYYYARCNSKNKIIQFKKVLYDSSLEYMSAIHPEKIKAQKKNNYLLNNFSIISIINDSRIEKVFFCIN